MSDSRIGAQVDRLSAESWVHSEADRFWWCPERTWLVSILEARKGIAATLWPFGNVEVFLAPAFLNVLI